MINKKLIKSFCNRFNIKNYSINLDGSIDVYGLVNLDGYIDEELQIKFNIVSGYFFCSNSKINSFKNFPNFIGGEFDCYWNPLESLDGLKIPYKNFYCINKKLLVRKHKLKQSINL